MSHPPLIPIALWSERCEWEPQEKGFLSCDLCGDSELGPWMRHPKGTWPQMYWDNDGIIVCQTCKETGEHLKLEAA